MNSIINFHCGNSVLYILRYKRIGRTRIYQNALPDNININNK